MGERFEYQKKNMMIQKKKAVRERYCDKKETRKQYKKEKYQENWKTNIAYQKEKYCENRESQLEYKKSIYHETPRIKIEYQKGGTKNKYGASSLSYELVVISTTCLLLT